MKLTNPFLKSISKIIPGVMISLIFMCCANKAQNKIPANSKASKETVQLYNLLYEIPEKGIMFGHQDDLAYGVKWKYQEGESDIKRVVNDYPAIFGWDLGNIELDAEVNLDSVPFDKMRQFIIHSYNMGGINTISWHLNNPATGGNAWDTNPVHAVKSILPKGANHEIYKFWLDIVAQFLKSLKTEDGIMVPVIFRPFHEFSGSWFWWGSDLCTKDEFVQLWQFTFNYLTKTKDVNNILFCFSSSGDFKDGAEYLTRFPGKEFVDIIGFDTYQFPGLSNTDFITHLQSKLKILADVAKELNIPYALTETGFEQIPDTFWWTEVLWKGIEQSGISYVHLWRNACEKDKPNHFYVPYNGQLSEKDFIAFENLDRTLFLSDLQQN